MTSRGSSHCLGRDAPLARETVPRTRLRHKNGGAPHAFAPRHGATAGRGVDQLIGQHNVVVVLGGLVTLAGFPPSPSTILERERGLIDPSWTTSAEAEGMRSTRIAAVFFLAGLLVAGIPLGWYALEGGSDETFRDDSGSDLDRDGADDHDHNDSDDHDYDGTCDHDETDDHEHDRCGCNHHTRSSDHNHGGDPRSRLG